MQVVLWRMFLGTMRASLTQNKISSAFCHFLRKSALGAPGASMGEHVRCTGQAYITIRGTRKMCRNSSWQQLRPMLHLTRGCPLILSSPSTFFPFFFSLLFSALRQLRAVLHLPWGCPSPQFTLPPFLTRSKEVSGVTVSTACRLSVPPIPSPQNTKSSAFPEPTATVPHSLLFIWEGRHPLIFGISGHYEISLTPKPWSKLFRKHLSSLPSGDSLLDDCRLFRSGSGLEWR